MAFRATNIIPSEQYERAKKLAVQLKRIAADRATQFAAGGNADEILSMADNLNGLKAGLQQAAAVPGIAAYAIEQEDDPAYAVGAEFNATIAAIDAVITEIVTTIPTHGSGFVLIHSINPDATLTPRDFTGTQLANLVTLINAVEASVV